MFEKSRASNMTAQVNMIPASLVLSTGETLSGNITSTGPGRLIDVLNAATAFIEFHTHDGEIRHINKSAVISLAQPDLPRTDQLARRNADAAAFDPYAVLGVNRDATPTPFAKPLSGWPGFTTLTPMHLPPCRAK
jgi:hypothetical protein